MAPKEMASAVRTVMRNWRMFFQTLFKIFIIAIIMRNKK